MKKIIALAVAGAFVVPAVHAAEITLGGEIEYVMIMEEGTDDRISDNDNLIFVQGTDELPNGMTVTGIMQIVNDTDTGAGSLDNQGTSLTFAGDFGSLGIGDVSGASDATGDWTDIAPTGGGFGADGDDHAFLLTLPAMNGVTLRASFAPDGANTIGEGDGDVSPEGGNAISVTYSGPVDLYYAQQEDAATNLKDAAYGVRGSFSGISIAYESASEEAASGNDNDVSGFSMSYKMGDIVLGGEKQEEKIEGSDATVDLTLLFVEYNLGPVDIYAASLATDVTSDNDEVRVGVEYNF